MDDNIVMGTIEVMRDAVGKKFDLIMKIIKQLDSIPDQSNVCCLQKQALELLDEYEHGSAQLISDYYKYCDENIILPSVTREKKNNILRRREQFKQQFQKYLMDECIFSKLNQLLQNIQILMHKYDCEFDIPELEVSELETVNYLSQNTEYSLCKCGARMDIDENSRMLVCKLPNCGLLLPLKGVIFEDDYYYFQDGKRNKHCNYDPSKHCKTRLDQIQAREIIDVPSNLIDQLLEYICQDGILNKQEITCEYIRKYLRQIGQSQYYNHVTLIRKMLTGIEPPQLTEEEYHEVMGLFKQVARIYNSIKTYDNPNLRYILYFIYKIIEHVLRDEQHTERREGILDCIHLQSRETVIEHDKKWQEICNHLPIEYRPTVRNSKTGISLRFS